MDAENLVISDPKLNDGGEIVIIAGTRGGIGKTTVANLYSSFYDNYYKINVPCYDFDESRMLSRFVITQTQDPTMSDLLNSIMELESKTVIVDFPGSTLNKVKELVNLIKNSKLFLDIQLKLVFVLSAGDQDYTNWLRVLGELPIEMQVKLHLVVSYKEGNFIPNFDEFARYDYMVSSLGYLPNDYMSNIREYSWSIYDIGFSFSPQLVKPGANIIKLQNDVMAEYNVGYVHTSVLATFLDNFYCLSL